MERCNSEGNFVDWPAVNPLAHTLRKAVLSISAEETTFKKRGFSCPNPAAKQHLERVGLAFCQGYNMALGNDEPSALTRELHEVPLEFRGFAFEGSAMSLGILDYLTPWRRNRWARFFAAGEEGDDHIYMAIIGRGWAIARLKRRIEPAMKKLDPVLGWLLADGYGFHEGFFHPGRTIEKRIVPGSIRGYARRVFDQGLGRSLWFVRGADIDGIAGTIAGFEDRTRRSDLWCGIGLACTYAGGIDDAAVISVLESAGDEFRLQVAQGAAFAAKARMRAGNPNAHTERACEILCGTSAEEAAALTDEALAGIDPMNGDPAYEVWRLRIQERLSGIAV